MKTTDLGKWSRKSRFQEALPDKVVRCHICPHNCIIHDGKAGFCKTRVNSDGTLYTISYGNPCSLGVDPIEKKPLFHFLPGSRIFSLATAGCNFRCLNCQNWQISQVSPAELDHYDLMPEDIIYEAIRHKTNMIAFTYTEPTVFYEYVYDTAKLAHENGLKTVFISNGYINPEPLKELIPLLDAANIDLKCMDDDVYRKLTGARLQPVLDTLIALKKNGVWLEITNLLVPGYSDKTEQIKALCTWLAENGFTDTPLHFSRFFPNYKLPHLSPTEVSRLVEAKEIAEEAGLKYIYIGNLPGIHEENTVCPNCKTLLVERAGFVVSKNNIKEGKCSQCGESINGIW